MCFMCFIPEDFSFIICIILLHYLHLRDNYSLSACTERLFTSECIIDRTGGRTMLYLTCSMILGARYMVSRCKLKFGYLQIVVQVGTCITHLPRDGNVKIQTIFPLARLKPAISWSRVGSTDHSSLRMLHCFYEKKSIKTEIVTLVTQNLDIYTMRWILRSF